MALWLLLFSLGLTLPLTRLPLTPHGSLRYGTLDTQLFDGLALLAVAIFALRPSAWRRARWQLLLYPAALGFSAAASSAPRLCLGPLMRDSYLTCLALAVSGLIAAPGARTALRRGWLCGWGLTLLGSLVGAVGFYAGWTSPMVTNMLFQHGSLGEGHFPRLCSTFHNANMFCNYLIVTAGWMLVDGRLLWLSALPTLSPGIGPLTGLLAWRNPSRGIRALGVAAVVLFFMLTWTYPLEALHGQFRSTARVQCWLQAFGLWARHPLLGWGPGQAHIAAYWTDPNGGVRAVFDAHNSTLSLASQGGALALVVLLWLTLGFTPRRPPLGGTLGAWRNPLGRAICCALWLDGLTGSFEHARHIWLALGVALAAPLEEPQSEAPDL